VVIPTFNERENLPVLVSQLMQLPAVRVLVDGLAELDGITVFGPTSAGAGLQALAHAPDEPVLCDALALVAPPARAEGRLRVAVDPPRV